MPVELSQLMQLVAGKLPALQVGDLPRPVAEHLGCHPAIVWLGHNEVQKIVMKHGDCINVPQLQCLPFAIRDGAYYFEPNRLKSVTVFHRFANDDLQYVIGLKPADRGSEVWVQTFFRIDDTKANKRMAKSTLLFHRRS